ncbi:hypothetical protein, partial [Spirosoma sp.]|uniref:hypothetical protein n=1 Tax=Spirosoma sp. TaxID=1899569 RepID=UPI003B3B328A
TVTPTSQFLLRLRFTTSDASSLSIFCIVCYRKRPKPRANSQTATYQHITKIYSSKSCAIPRACVRNRTNQYSFWSRGQRERHLKTFIRLFS